MLLVGGGRDCKYLINTHFALRYSTYVEEKQFQPRPEAKKKKKKSILWHSAFLQTVSKKIYPGKNSSFA